MKDKTLAKYFLDSFTQKINELTPSLNSTKRKFFDFNKTIIPLKQTKEMLNKKDKFNEKELKEFSLLFLIINFSNVFRKNIEAASEINFSSVLLQDLHKLLIKFLVSEKYFNIEKFNAFDFDKKYLDIINLINNIAPVKVISKNKNEIEILNMFNEIFEEIKKIDLKKRIDTLEDKVSLNLDEKLYSELLSLRNQLKSG